LCHRTGARHDYPGFLCFLQRPCPLPVGVESPCFLLKSNDHSTFAGVVLASDEGKHIAKALGSRKAVLLGNHGLLTAGRTIEEVVAYFVLLDKCCEVQLAADASSGGTGKPLVKIGEVEAFNTWKAIGTKENGYCKLITSVLPYLESKWADNSDFIVQGLPLFQTVEGEFGERTYLGRGLEPI
jgi:hypothetical protein